MNDSKEEALRLLLTDPVLAVIAEAARIYGWRADYVEVGRFAEWCFEIAGKPSPDLEPYPYD